MTNTRAKELAGMYNRDFWYNRHWRVWVISPITEDGRDSQYLPPTILHTLTGHGFIENYLLVESGPNPCWLSPTYSVGGIRIISDDT